MRKSLLVLILILLISSLRAQDPYFYTHPELEWFTFETEHFFVHFHQGTERTARIVGKIAEDIHGPVTQLYQFDAPEKIHFIIKDTDDYSNGGAFFFDNKVEIWAENLDYVMRGTRNWLRDVVTHEYTHMISIMKMTKSSRTVPYGFFQFFGYERERRKDVVRGFPNTIVSYPIASINIPVWFAEGTAQYQASPAKFDYRDPNREMIIRDRVIHDEILTYGEMGVFGKTSHGNESAYNLGYAYVDWLCTIYGDSILEKISDYNSKWGTITFDQAIREATQTDPDSLYNSWKLYLAEKYNSKLSRIVANELKGQAIERTGFSNLYPVWSPDGTKIAYISNQNNDYFSQNSLIVYDRTKKTKKKLVSGISSSLSWSPDGRYLAYSKPTGALWPSSTYNDLWIYDLEEDEELITSLRLRAKNPDWSSDGSKLVFVTETNGLNQLMMIDLGEDAKNPDRYVYYFDPETGVLLDSLGQSKYLRKVSVRGKMTQLYVFEDGRQIYHPRWSRDDKHIIMDTATDYGRDIAIYDVTSDSFFVYLEGKHEIRYPIYHPAENTLYYSSAETGIYNLYKMDLDTKETSLITNVPGGAVMPDINLDGEIIYSCYDSLGYHIYLLKDHPGVDPAVAKYEDNYLASIPELNFDDSKLPEVEIKPYKQTFTGLHILPRLMIDYNTVKPGLYVFANDVLDKMTMIGGGAVNLRGDYDLFGLFEYRKLGPTLFIEAYNMNANITDTLGIPTSETNVEIIDQDINFNLTEIQTGVSFQFPSHVYWRMAYIISLYDAKLNWFDPFAEMPFTFRYRYLSGRAAQLSMHFDMVKRDRYSHINPSGGRYVYFKYAYEHNEFLSDFKTGTSLNIEVYEPYFFHRFEFDWEEYFKVPIFKNHSFAARIRAGLIDRPVDDFFWLYAGGLIGMKGYSYYSLGGTKKLITTLTYRFPLANNIDWQLFTVYLDKLYFGVFYDYGYAWDENELDFNDFKRDLGFQIRLDTFSNFLFPTKIFWEAVYPFDSITINNINYETDWRYYFGILFEFDIRERFGSMIRRW